MSKGDRIEIYGMAETSSRMSLKKTMETFGEVIGCHIGNRGVDWPVVRFQQAASAEAAIEALKGKQVWLDGVVLEGDWKGSRPQKTEGRKAITQVYDEDGRRRPEDTPSLTSRELFMGGRRSRDRGGRDRDRDRDRERDRDRKKRSRSRRRRDRS
mmetsp:Transcript_54184/g.150756  ORF Transcript_54184/g.150756 Transcript_54184/m.150756 type:complete len:155 (-) Transcript_54184:68-532(-)